MISSAPKARVIGRSSAGLLEVVRCFREKADETNPAVEAAGFFVGSLHAKSEGNPELLQPWHEPAPLSKAACNRGWRFTEKLFSGRGFAATRIAGRCFGFARAATAGNSTARLSVVAMCGASSVEQPTGDISRAPRAGWIIVTASGPIDAGSCCAA